MTAPRRRRLAIAGLATVALAIAAPTFAAANTGAFLYVANEGTGDLSVIQASTHEVVATIELKRRARGMALSPDGRSLYVAISGAPLDAKDKKARDDVHHPDGVVLVNLTQRKIVATLRGLTDPQQLAVSNDAARLFIANGDTGALTIVDVANGGMVNEVTLGKEPTAVAATPDGAWILVASARDNAVDVLNPDSGRFKVRLPVGKRPSAIAVAPEGGRAYVTNEAAGTVSEIDTGNSKVVRTLKLPPKAQPLGAGLSPDGKRLWVANGRLGTVSVVDLDAGKVLKSVKAGARPRAVAVAPDGRFAYVADSASGSVSVIDTTTFATAATIKVGSKPRSLLFASQ